MLMSDSLDKVTANWIPHYWKNFRQCDLPLMELSELQNGVCSNRKHSIAHRIFLKEIALCDWITEEMLDLYYHLISRVSIYQ